MKRETDMTYEIEGFRNRAWTVLFTSYKSAIEALAYCKKLRETNPACRYRVVRVFPNHKRLALEF